MNRLTILGIGSLQSGPAIVGALATYFGERPLEVVLWDPDAERLELFDRFLRVACTFNQAIHLIRAVETAEEALEDAWRIVVSLDRNGAFRYLRSIGKGSEPIPAHTHVVAEACRHLLVQIHPDAEVLEFTEEPTQLPVEFHYRLPAPAALTPEEKQALPYQIMRWIRGEDMLYEFLAAHDRSPIKAWLDDATTAQRVSEG